MTTVATLMIEMAADVARLQKNMDQVVATVDGAMSKVRRSGELATKVLGAIGVGLSANAFAGFIRGSIDAADSASKLSQRMGTTVSEVAGLKIAFQQSGLEGDALVGAMARLAKAAVDNSDGFQKLGINAKNADGTFKSTRVLLGEVSDKFTGLRDGAQKTALSMELFGKSGGELIPLLNGGSESLDEFDATAKRLGVTISETTAIQAEKFNDNLDLLKSNVDGIATGIATAMLPTLVDLSETFLSLATNVDQLTTEFGPYLAGGAITLGLAALPTAITAVSVAVTTKLLPAMITLGPYVAAFAAVAGTIGYVISRMQAAEAGLATAEAAQTKVANLTAQIAKAQELIDKGQGSSVTVSRVTAMKAELAKAEAAVLSFSTTSKKELPKVAEAATTLAKTQAQIDKEEAARKAKKAEAEKERERLDKVKERQMEALQKAINDNIKANEDLVKTESSVTEQIKAQVESLRAQNQTFGLTTKAIHAMEQAKIDDEIATVKMRVSLAEFGMLNRELIPEYQAQIQALQNLKAEKDGLFSKTETAAQAKQFEEDFNVVSSDIKRALTEALVNGTQDAGDFIKNYFKSLVIRLAINPALDAGESVIKSAIQAGSSQSSGGGFSISNLSNVYSALSGGFLSSLASGIGSVGSLFGSSAISSFATGIQGSTLAAGLAGPTTVGAAGAVGAGSAFAAAAAPVAIAYAVDQLLLNGKITNTITKVLGLGGKRGPKTESFTGQFDSSLQVVGSGIKVGSTDITQGIANTVAEQYNALIKQLGVNAEKIATNVFLSIDTEGDAMTQLGLDTYVGNQLAYSRTGSGRGFENVGRSQEELTTTVAEETLRAIVGALQKTDFADNIDELLKPLDAATSSVVELNRALQGVQVLDVINDLFAGTNTNLSALAGASLSTVEMFVQAVGGMENLGTALADFQAKFYSQAEQTSILTTRVEDAFKALNLTVPTTRDEFRKLLEAQEVTTESGARTYAALLSLRDAMDQLLPPLGEAAAAVENTTQSVTDLAAAQDRINSERFGLETQLLQLQGKTAELRQRELDALDPSNRALQEQINAMRDLETAQQTRTQSIQLERQALERIAGVGRSIVDYVRGLSMTEQTLTPKQRLQASSAEFNRLAALAQGGDEDAQSQITRVSDQFLNSAREFYGATSPFQGILETVKSTLLNLPAVQTYEQKVLSLLTNIQSTLEDRLMGLISSVSNGFSSIDLNVDGGIDFAELQAALAGKATDSEIRNLILAVDTSGNGLITKFELELAKVVGSNQLTRNAIDNGFTQLDTTVDGRLTFDELKSGLGGLASEVTLQEVFRGIDANGDGFISKLEATNAKLDGLAVAIKDNLAPLFGQIDTNVSGGISKAEFEQAFGSFGLGPRLDRIFSELDINGDGTINRLEAGNFTSSNQLIQDTNALAQLQYIARLTYEIEQMAIRSAGSGIYVRPPAGGDPFNFNLNDIRGGIGNWIKVQSLNQAGTNAVRFRDGGLVTGPGSGTSDSIPAMVSNGEYWMKASTVKARGVGFMDSINRGDVPVMPVSQGADMSAVVAQLSALRAESKALLQRIAAQEVTVPIKVVTPDGKTTMEETLKQLKDRSRRGELVVYTAGVR